jgi:uncharacterized membrane protein
MSRRFRLRIEQVRGSLFFVPALYVAAAIAAAVLMRALDHHLASSGVELPLVLQFTPESARVLLSTIAGATVTVAGTVFAVTVVSIQLGSSQFSPRVIPGFLRDSQQKQVMGFIVGTFTYCLLVLSSVAGSSADPWPGVPHLSVDFAVAQAVAAILGIVAYLDHMARSLQVGEIIRRVARETVQRIDELFPNAAGDSRPPIVHDEPLPEGASRIVRSQASGWVRHVDLDRILEALPAGGIFALDVRNGSFVGKGQPVGRLWPSDGDAATVEQTVRSAVVLGGTRMMLQDVAFGIRQLVDIALRALSPGINDPTTAYDVIVHLGDVLRDLLWRDLAPVVRVRDRRRLISAADLSHDDYVSRTFDQIRVAAAAHSAMVAALLIVLGSLVADLERDGLAHRALALRRQAALLMEGFAAANPLEADLASVRSLAARHGLSTDAARG